MAPASTTERRRSRWRCPTVVSRITRSTNTWPARLSITCGSQKSITPDRPFFVYYAPGATHAPHHVPREWMAKFQGKFDQGWDRYREETYQRQRQLGVIPKDAKLTPRPHEIPAWDSLSDDQKKVAARLMEAFAGYTAQTDHEIGRLIQAIEDMGQLDNTLIVWEIGDNGASMEGTLSGVFNEMSSSNGVPEETSFAVKHIDEIGGPKSYNHYPVGWAWAMNTPFQWGKQVASAPRRGTQPRSSSRGRSGSRTRGASARSSTTASTSFRPSWRQPASPSRTRSTASRRSRSRASACSTPSPTRRRRAPAGLSTSRCSATGRSTTTAGSPRPAGTAACRGRISARPDFDHRRVAALQPGRRLQ